MAKSRPSPVMAMSLTDCSVTGIDLSKLNLPTTVSFRLPGEMENRLSRLWAYISSDGGILRPSGRGGASGKTAWSKMPLSGGRAPSRDSKPWSAQPMKSSEIKDMMDKRTGPPGIRPWTAAPHNLPVTLGSGHIFYLAISPVF